MTDNERVSQRSGCSMYKNGTHGTLCQSEHTNLRFASTLLEKGLG